LGTLVNTDATIWEAGGTCTIQSGLHLVAAFIPMQVCLGHADCICELV